MRGLKHLVFFTVIVVFGATALAGALAFAVPATRSLAFDTTSESAVTPVLRALEQRSVILDRNGRTIDTLYATEDRAPVTLRDVSGSVVAAVISIEDRTFFSHAGVDPKSILRALFRDVHSGVVEQGGSTITQQLVKNTLIENPKRDLQRKVREAVLAMRLEENYTKNQILERYLNTVYFGRDAYGIRAASERYFNEQPSQLALPQAALLAGMISAPSGYDPIDHPQAAHDRRHTVLEAMHETGVISTAAVKAFDKVPLPTHTFNNASIAPTSYFVSEVVQRLLADPRLGPDEPTRRNLIYHGGLRITTTFDPTLQTEAEGAVRSTIADAARDPAHVPVTGALVAIDNSNGAVRAMVSGSGDESGAAYLAQQFNYATGSNRQVGSSFKVFTLATALENGYSPKDTIDGGRCTIPAGLNTKGEPYSPGGDSGGVMTLQHAITDSINCAFVRLIVALGADPANLNEVGSQRAQRGPQKVINVARQMGVTSTHLTPVTSLTLGTDGVSPLDMASAYSTLANDGVHKKPIFYTKVEGPDGKVVFEIGPNGDHPTQVMPVNIARTETQMLFGPVRDGTAARTLRDFPREVAGKTGTTDENVDAWFVGYSPQITTAVWMGDPAGEISMNSFFKGGDVFGGTIPARIWDAFMSLALAPLPPASFTPPDDTLWPSSRYIAMTGRGTGAPPTTTTTAPPVPITTAPTPTTAPKGKAHPPKTTPTTKAGP
jgi:penicillin-binding protein 1A